VSKTPSLTLNDIAVLGLLAQSPDEPLNGKRLDETIEKRGMRVWTNIGKSSVYHCLKKLENLSYLKSHKKRALRGANKPPLTEVWYQITSLGSKTLKNNVLRIITSPKKIIDPFDIAYASWIDFTKDEMVDALEARMANMQTRKNHLREGLAYAKSPEARGVSVHGEDETTPEILRHIQALFSRPLAFIKCEEKWIKSLISEYKK
jgi:DNA-binding PadR family transcriptional regulator